MYSVPSILMNGLRTELQPHVLIVYTDSDLCSKATQMIFTM